MDDKNIIIEKLISNILQSGSISLVKGGTLKGIPEKRSLHIIDGEGKSRFLGAIPYEIKTKTNKTIIIDEDLVAETLSQFEKDHTFDDLNQKYIKYKEDEQTRKDNSKINLEYLKSIIKFIETETNGSKIPELKRHPREFYYYIDVKFNDGDLVRIYSLEEGKFVTTTFNNYMDITEKLEVSKTELTFLLKDKIKIHFDLQSRGKSKDVDNAYAKEMREVRNSRIKILCDYILNDKINVIFKITDGYQCILNKKRFSIGDNKTGKEYDIKDTRQIEEYIKRMDIKQYYSLTNEQKEKVKDFTTEELNNMKFMFL